MPTKSEQNAFRRGQAVAVRQSPKDGWSLRVYWSIGSDEEFRHRTVSDVPYLENGEEGYVHLEEWRLCEDAAEFLAKRGLLADEFSA